MLTGVKQSGFSLVEALVGAGLIAGIALMAANLFSQQSSNVKLVETQEKLNAYHSNLRKMMTDENNCNATFASTSPVTSIPLPATFAFKSCCPQGSVNCAINPGDEEKCASPRGNAVAINSADTKVLLSTASPNNFTDGTRKIRLKEVRYYDPSTRTYVNSLTASTTSPGPNKDKLYELHMDYGLEHIKGGVGTVRKVIPLSLRFNQSGQFRGCSTERSASTDMTRKAMCESLNDVDGNVDLVRWVEDASGVGSCVSQPRRQECPAGTVMSGINSSGNTICANILENVHTQDVIGSSGGNVCASGTTIRFVKVGNKIRLECN
jgi:type II secretory pathway pseudopilin PulG